MAPSRVLVTVMATSEVWLAFFHVSFRLAAGMVWNVSTNCMINS
jgi:hypothetical protein